MANQPTKYRKFIVGAASAALVASAVAPVASAAEFKDTKGNTHEPAIDALSDAGIITGYPDGTFQPNKTLTRSDVVKLMGKWLVSEGYAVPTDYKTNPRFADLKSTSNDELLQYAAVVKDNGVFVGTPDGKLDPAGNITRENMAIVLVRAFDRVHDIDLATYVAGQEFKKDVTDLGRAKAEARPAIDVLDFFDITNPAAPQFNPKGTTTRGHFATFLHKTINADFSDVGSGVVGTANVKAVNATTVEVTFKDAVENLNSLNFTIDGLTVSNAAIKQSDNKVVVLTTAVQKGGEKYTVSLNNQEIGSFEGISAVVPTKLDVTTQNVQGKVGQQAILSADVGVKQAGIPVTFNVKANTVGTLNKDQVFEAVTNADGIATFSYTQYAAGVDEVVAYPTGAPTVRDYATVHWGVDTILTLEEDDKKGTSLNNGENKVYKVTYKDPKTGKPMQNADIHVTFAENVDVAINKITDATINGKPAYQTTNGNKEYVTVRTDSKGEATFTVSGKNTKATPIVFIDNSGYGSNSVDKLDSTELQVKAAELTFGAVHVKYELEVTRDGGEEAAVGQGNGRVYKIAVKDENGKSAAGEVVNVAFDEVLDRVISTNTKAEFVIDNTEYKGTTNYYNTNNKQQIQIKLDSKGEAEFKIVSNDNKDYATPVIWIDINTSNNKDGVLEQGEPTKTAAMTYFADEKVQGSKLKVYNHRTGAEIKDNRPVVGTDAVEFRFDVANQSGEAFGGRIAEFDATYQVTNTGSSDVYVWKNAADVGNRDKATVISTRRGETFTIETDNNKQVRLYVASNGETASVDVTAYGEAREVGTDKKVVRLDESKVAKATFQSTSDLGTSYTGNVESFDKDKKKLKFVGKKELNYKEEFDAGKVKYEDARGSSTLNLNFAQFEDIVAASPNAKLHYYKNNDGVITFTILEATSNQSDVEAANAVTAKVTALPADITLANEAAVVDARAAYNALTTAQKALVTQATLDKLVAAEAKIKELKDAEQGDLNFTHTVTENTPLANTLQITVGTVASTPADAAGYKISYNLADGNNVEQEGKFNEALTLAIVKDNTVEATVQLVDADGNNVGAAQKINLTN
ncbi:surface layer protein [Bacillus sp. OxB-1]|uniref:S-layer homology domain-containing protein n=1 Tax=Bacillus sp. (strain OxB-1) TaxID=98228 RepID=UPI0005820797|nr:S-layer homology domain-containing protein [Bacillus sp. OxB-1]BAQ09953.1 surface layer protein [Bacillus sp. OxB-1]